MAPTLLSPRSITGNPEQEQGPEPQGPSQATVSLFIVWVVAAMTIHAFIRKYRKYKQRLAATTGISPSSSPESSSEAKATSKTSSSFFFLSLHNRKHSNSDDDDDERPTAIKTTAQDSSRKEPRRNLSSSPHPNFDPPRPKTGGASGTARFFSSRPKTSHGNEDDRRQGERLLPQSHRHDDSDGDDGLEGPTRCKCGSCGWDDDIALPVRVADLPAASSSSAAATTAASLPKTGGSIYANAERKWDAKKWERARV